MSWSTGALRRIPILALLAACAVCAGSASAATPNQAYFEYGIYPAGAFTPPGETPSTATGYFYASYYAPGAFVPRRVELVRGGAVVTDATGPQPGDVIRIVRLSDSAVLAQITVDDKPSLDASSCIGQNGFAGVRVPDSEIHVRNLGAFTTQSSPYGGSYLARDPRRGRIRKLDETTFAGIFDAAIADGDLLQAEQNTETADGDLTMHVTATVSRLAAACPPPPPPVKDTTAPKQTSFDLGAPGLTTGQFLKFGLASFIGIDEPATVSQEIYLDNGAALPAQAAKKRKKPKTKKKTVKALTLVGSGKTASAVAGIVKVQVKPNAAAKRNLKRGKPAKLVLITTIRDASGNATTVSTKLKLPAT